MAKLHPTGDRVVVRPDVAEETLASGLILPATAIEKPQRGEVLAVGPGLPDQDGVKIPLDLEPGDSVLYSRYGGSEVEHDDETLLILRAGDVLAVLA